MILGTDRLTGIAWLEHRQGHPLLSRAAIHWLNTASQPAMANLPLNSGVPANPKAVCGNPALPSQIDPGNLEAPCDACGSPAKVAGNDVSGGLPGPRP